jgi:hypothetical protein
MLMCLLLIGLHSILSTIPVSVPQDYVTRFGTAGVWPQAIGNVSVAWNATCMQTAGDGGPLANLVNTTAFSIGYAKRRTAARNCVACASGALQTKFGTFVTASDASLQLAASTTALPTPVDITWAQLSMGQQTTSPGAYPATHFSFMVVLQYRANEANYPEVVSRILADFMLFAAYGAGQVRARCECVRECVRNGGHRWRVRR